MAKRIQSSVVFAVSVGAAGCVARHPPWELWSRSGCDDVSEQVDRSRERPDQLEWYRNDLKTAVRAEHPCKQTAAVAASGGSK